MDKIEINRTSEKSDLENDWSQPSISSDFSTIPSAPRASYFADPVPRATYVDNCEVEFRIHEQYLF